MKAADVITGGALWSCEQGDCVAWLESLPDDSVDLLFTSPLYRMARTYGIGAGLGTEDWTAWMVKVVRAAAPKVKGLIAINCEGQTENYRYHPTPYLLLADLHREGFNLRRPAFFHRIGIPGSGGPDWLRADVEPIICVTRAGKLPWSDNTAMGHPPKWAPGGSMSNRVADGTRANQKESPKWLREGMHTGVQNKIKLPKRTRAEKVAAGAKLHTKRDAGDNDPMREQAYLPPVLANPGNVVQQTYTPDEVAELLDHASEVVHCNVGGGQMGSPHAHENEAPFPLSLPTFFIRSFCPPGGVVADCFGGSGTTMHAAVENGRRGVSCDLRESQVDLCKRRMKNVSPPLFTDAA